MATDVKSQDISQDKSKSSAPSQPNQTSGTASTSNPPSKIENNSGDAKSSQSNAQPLAPPPKPSQSGSEGQGDYFTGGHNNSHFSLEPNPFEQSFSNQSQAETPGKFGGLPSVASLTSPAPLGPGSTPGWQNSLRSGPLSPAMLPGPTNQNGYFDDQFRGSFPTPNESSLRTGLTPGGGGSMFPAASPSSQALFSQLQNGGATPGTIDFHRSAMSAAARNKNDPAPTNSLTNNNQATKPEYQPAQQAQQQPQDFGSHPESDAVNSLYMLANNNRSANQFAVQNQPQNANQMQTRLGAQGQDGSQGANPNKMSIGSADDNGAEGNGGRSRASGGGSNKKGGKGGQAGNGRKRADDNAAKQSANKRRKAEPEEDEDDDDDDEGMDDNDDDDDQGANGGTNPSGKKLTDEEKRKNFLERNRVAALKCRQRKKQWLANLQTKVEIFGAENESLNNQCTALREELVNLKTLLLAHKDCPVSHSQGLGGAAMAQVIGNFDPNQPGTANYLQHYLQMQQQGGMQQR